jgi:hypothetical protein
MFESPNNFLNFFHEKRPFFLVGIGFKNHEKRPFFLVGIGFTRSQPTPVSMSQTAPDKPLDYFTFHA